MKDEELENLLPWYVNGTLESHEVQAVEDYLARSEAARDSKAFLTALSQQVQAESLPPVSELGWRRLQKEIQREQTQSVDKKWWMGAVAAAALLVITLQVSIFTPSQQVDTRLLGQPVAEFLDNHWLLQIELQDDYVWHELVSMMNMMDATIVSGPSRLGVIRIAVPQESEVFENQQQLLNWLQQQPGVLHATMEMQ